MNIDIAIIAAMWIIPVILLILFVPRNKLREAQVIFFFKQLITWLIGLTVVEFDLIEYPVRLFDYASRTSFTFEYFTYPAICVIFNLNYPEGKSRTRQFLHFFYYCSVITIIEALCEEYTNVIHYIHWTWYITWITLFITFFLSRKYYKWFFKEKAKTE